MSEVDPDLGLHLISQGRKNATVNFSRVPILQVARIGPEKFTQVQILELDQSYCASFDFDARQMNELVLLLPPELAKHMESALALPFTEPHVLDLADHSIAVDVRAHIGPVQTNDDERFAPFVVEKFSAASALWAMDFEERATDGGSGLVVADSVAADFEPAPEPAAKPQRKRRAASAFLECDAEEQSSAVWQALILVGQLEKDQAVRLAAQSFRENGTADFQRLDAAGSLYLAILKAIERNVKDGSMDRPQRGHVRACVVQPEQLDRDDWQKLLVGALENGALARAEVVRAVAEHARLIVNLPFERLREDGKIAKAILSAINGALRKSLIVDERGVLSVANDLEKRESPVEDEEGDDEAEDAEDEAHENRPKDAGDGAAVMSTPVAVAAAAVAAAQPLMAFSWGYYGWGNHTRELVNVVDLVEASRGFAPPMFVDVRLRRQVRAPGFRERAFEHLLGPERHRWLPGLGNRQAGDKELETQTLDDPATINLLLELITKCAAENRRVIFFCSCQSPDQRQNCHRGLVVDLLVKTSRKCKVPLAVQEWPGGVPVVATLRIPAGEMAKLLPLAASEEVETARLPLPKGVSLAYAAALPHLSVLRCQSGDNEVVAASGPIIHTVRGWVFPIYVVNTADGSLTEATLKGFERDFKDAELAPVGAKIDLGRVWTAVDLSGAGADLKLRT